MFFIRGASLGRNYEIDTNTQRIIAFNSQFDKYVGVTKQNDASKGYSFIQKGNIPSDVITCANLAYNINRKNEYDEKNHVKVIVKADKTYYIYPYSSQPQNCFLLVNETTAKNAKNSSSFNNSQRKSFYDFLKDYSDMKVVTFDNTSYKSVGETVYKYYFDVDENGLTYSDVTGKIKQIIFSAKETKNFENL